MPATQPPTREQIAETIYTVRAGSKQNWHKAAFRDDYLKEADAVLDLLSQPTPSAEPTCTCGHIMDDHDLSETGECQVAIPWCPCMAAKDVAEPDYHLYRAVRLADGHVAGPWAPGERAQISDAASWREEVSGPGGWTAVQPAEPPSIADMAPGTTFTGRKGLGLEQRMMRLEDGWAISTDGHTCDATVIDPSTIRDVTPPPATCEFGHCTGGDTPQHHTVECFIWQRGTPEEPT